MFLFLGLVGVKMGRKITGVIGVLAMLVDTVLAYGVALTYFFGSGQGQMVDGVRQAVVVANPAWLSFTDTLVVLHRIMTSHSRPFHLHAKMLFYKIDSSKNRQE